MNDIEFGKTIKDARTKKGWSQGKLSKEAGISQGSISRIEAGSQKNLTKATKDALLQALGINDDDIGRFGGFYQSTEYNKWCSMVIDILESEAVYADALKQNISAFHTATKAKQERDHLIHALEQRMTDQRNDVIQEYETKLQNMRLEMQSVRQMIEKHQKMFEEKGFQLPTATDEEDGTQK